MSRHARSTPLRNGYTSLSPILLVFTISTVPVPFRRQNIQTTHHVGSIKTIWRRVSNTFDLFIIISPSDVAQ